MSIHGQGLSEYGKGLMDGTCLADALPNWLIADMVLRYERATDGETDWHEGNRVAMAAVLDGRDSAWRTYAPLNPVEQR